MSNAVVQSIRGYEIIDLIGRGGFGEVYRAKQLEVDREIALKIVRPEFANLPNFVRRFEAEARLIARLEHPHIVPLYDYWRTPDGAYFGMRYLRGGSLRTKMVNGQLRVKQVTDYVDQIASAVAFAHRHGVVHCDLKPSNVLFDHEDNVYLVDFGIARAIQESDTVKYVSGSPTYISPEQIAKQPVTPKSDIYSLGILLFELLTGMHPFGNITSIEAMFDKHLYETLPPAISIVPSLPVGVDDVLQTATAKNPALRYVDALQLALTFRQVMKTLSPHALINTATPDNEFIEVDTIQFGGDSTIIYETEAIEIRNPYKGLRPFFEEDAGDFFGRGGLIQRLATRLRIDTPYSNFLALVGPSGMGKSSVVRAGLIPALRRGDLIEGSDHWFISDMVPGKQAIESLHEALLRVAVGQSPTLLDQLTNDEHGLSGAIETILPANSEFLLFIDQFEELFLINDDPTTIQHFLRLIRNAVVDSNGRIKTIIAIRADFYDRPLIYPEFSELLRARSEIVGPMSVDEIEQAITEPLKGLGITLEQGLAASIITDIYQQPGSLPMLQYSLTELFDRRAKNALTINAYREVGGVLGALTRKAEEVFTTLSADGQRLAKTLFLRLVSIGEGAEDTRTRANYYDLVALDPDAMPSVIEAFGDARLLTFDRDSITRETTVEVAHEAIIRHWSQLRTWLDDFRDDFRQFRLLRSAFEQWLANDKDESYLLVGNRLDRFNEWRRSTATILSEEHQAYLDASNGYHRLQVNQEQIRIQQVRELRRAALSRLRQLVLVLVIGLLVTVTFLVWAIRENRNAERERDNAETARQSEIIARMTSDANAAIAQTQVAIAASRSAETQSLLLATSARNALLNDNPDLAIALVIESVKIDPTSTEAYQILTEIAYQPNTRLYLEEHTTPISAIAVSPDGTLMMSGAELSVTVDPNHINFLLLWDLETGQLLHRFPNDVTSVNDVVISADGSTAFSAHQNGTVIAWSLPDGAERYRVVTEADSVEALALSPDGKSLLMSEVFRHEDDLFTQVSMWDLTTMSRATPFPQTVGIALNDIAISPNGAVVVASSQSTTEANDPSEVTSALVIAWDFETGEEQWRQVGGPQLIDSIPIALSPDSQTVLVAELQSFRINFFDMSTGELFRTIDSRRSGGHISRISGIDISPDGKRIITSSIGGAIVLWDLEAGEQLARLTGHRDQVTEIRYLPDGHSAVSGSQDTVLRVWDLEFSANLRQFVGHTKPVNSVAFLPSGELAISSSGDMEAAQSGDLAESDGNQLILWDIASGTPLRYFDNQPYPIVDVAVSLDGQYALSGSFLTFGFGHMVLWDIATGQEIRAFDLTDVLSVVTSVGFSPDGTTAASGTFSGKVQYWDLQSGVLIREFHHSDEPIITSIFSPDGRTILSTSSSGTSILWDVQTGEEVRRFEGSGPMVRSAFNNDGTRLITPIGNSDLIVWDVRTGQQIRHLIGHMGGGISVDFLPDDRYAISVGSDQILILWDVETGEILQRFVGHTETVFDVAASPDGRAALSASGDGTLIYWRIQNQPVDELVAWILANRYVPELSVSQRAQYNIQSD